MIEIICRVVLMIWLVLDLMGGVLMAVDRKDGGHALFQIFLSISLFLLMLGAGIFS